MPRFQKMDHRGACCSQCIIRRLRESRFAALVSDHGLHPHKPPRRRAIMSQQRNQFCFIIQQSEHATRNGNASARQ